MKKKLLTLSIFFICIGSFYNSSFTQVKTEIYDRFETSFKYAYAGNSFKDVSLTALFTGKDTSFTVTGFYDSDDIFKTRFMSNKTGTWNYITTSNKTELNHKKGSFECIPATGNNHGMVKVNNISSFKYADGKQYYPFGTTSYAWIHMGEGLQEITLNAFKNSGFNNVRMCVLPKSYELVNEEPELYPYLIKGVKKDA